MPFTSETAAEAGRKSKRGTGQRVLALNEFFEANKEQVIAIVTKVQEQAIAGDVQSQKLYMEYCFGKPEANIDVKSDGEQILGFNYFPSQRPENYQTKNGNGTLTKSGTV